MEQWGEEEWDGNKWMVNKSEPRLIAVGEEQVRGLLAVRCKSLQDRLKIKCLTVNLIIQLPTRPLFTQPSFPSLNFSSKILFPLF